jgi:hypothetical protein
MNLSVLENRVIEEPSSVVEELKHSDNLSLPEERLFARACVRAGMHDLLIARSSNNKAYEKDPGVLNFYVRALQAKNKWEEIAQLNSLLLSSNKSNALTLIKAFLRTKRFANAVELAEKFEFSGEDKTRASFLVFQALVKEKKYDLAISKVAQFEKVENENIFKWHILSIDELKRLKPYENSWVAFALARLLFKKRQFISVVSILKPFIGKPLPSALIQNYIFRYYGESLCNTLAKQPLLNELQVVLDAAKNNSDLDSFISLYSGHMMHIAGNFDQAVAKFNSADDSLYSLPSDKGAITVRSAKQIDTMEKKEHDEIIFDESNTHEKSDVVTVVASDSKYFLLFFDIYQKSFKANNGDYLLHFHIVNPDTDVKAKIADHQSNHSGVNFSYSNAVNTKNIKAFYASLRFLIAKQLLNYYECPLLITDIDAGFTGKLSHFNFEKQRSDISFKLRKDSKLFPWRLIPAGTVVINNTDGATRFLDYFSSYFYTIYADGEGNDIWWVDQSALYSLYRYFKGRGLVRFNNLYDSSNIDSLVMFPRPSETKQEFIDRVFSE